MKIETLFDVGDRVIMDDCEDLVAVVIAIMLRGRNVHYQVSWIQDGNLNEPWIEDWRLGLWVG